MQKSISDIVADIIVGALVCAILAVIAFSQVGTRRVVIEEQPVFEAVDVQPYDGGVSEETGEDSIGESDEQNNIEQVDS